MAPPAKRQKRLITLSPDGEGLDAEQTHKSISTRSRAKPIKINSNSTSIATQQGPNAIPRDFAAKLESTGKVQTSRPISSFFNQAQQPNGQKPAEAVITQVDDYEDLIVDDSAVEDANDFEGVLTRTVLDGRKKHLAPAHANVAPTKKTNLQGGSQGFKIPDHSSRNGISPETCRVGQGNSDAIDSRPWAEKYGPNNLEDLMVHKRKVLDVRNWLENVLRGHNRKRLLILKGPSGAGKTATIFMLAKAMGIDVSEWKNPVGSEFSSEAYLSMSAHFEDFLRRSGKFNKLVFADTDGNASATPLPTTNAFSERTRERIVLMEEFPNIFLSTSTALRSFRSSVLQYLASNTPSIGASLSRKQGAHLNVTPVVMIITETRLTTTTAASDSFTAHRLLGPELLSHPSVSTIEFNPIAPTYLTKALDLVVQKEARQSGRRRVPGPAVLKKLGAAGDVRSAVGSLEFLYLRGEDGDDWGGRVASRAKKEANASSSVLTKLETESLEMVTQRESTLGLFHAVGKVVYNKRSDFIGDDTTGRPPTQPPRYLSEHVRLGIAQVSTDQLMDHTGTDVPTFVAALHENFVLSCEGNSFTDHLEGCIDVLSDSDILSSPRGGRSGSSGDHGSRTFHGAASDTLRQDEICFQVAVRGLLFALPDPVKRGTHPKSGKSGGKNDTFKMYYPTSMRLSRRMEEIDSLVGQWMNRLRVSAIPLPKTTGWHGRHSTHLPSRQEMQPSKVIAEHQSRPKDDDREPFRTSLGCSNSELIVERLPYIMKIEQDNVASTLLDGLERITQFHGITPPGNEASEDEDIGEGALISDWTTDSQAEGNVTVRAPGSSLQEGIGQAGKAASSIVLPVEEEVGQLYLSDDDIEDI